MDANSRPKVLTFVTRLKGLEVAGLESQIYEEYVRISKICDLIVISEDVQLVGNETFSSVKVPKISIPKIRGFLKIIFYILAAFREHKKYDIIYVRTYAPPELLASLFSRILLQKKLIVLIPGYWVFSGNSTRAKFLRCIMKKLLSKTDKIILYSSLMIANIEDLLGNLNRNKIQIIKSAIDVERFVPHKSTQENSLICVSRIHPLKGIDNIIRIIPPLKNIIPDIKLKLVGTIESNDYFQYLNRMIAENNCATNVDFCGPVPNEKIIDYYTSSKVFILLSKSEGIPRSLLEAMACGKAVIATPISGIPDVIENKVNGFLFNPDDKKLVETIIKLLMDDKYCNEIGLNARKTIESNFTWNQFIKNLELVFRSI